MSVNGTLVNYFFHCKRQCWLHGNRINLEDESENVKVGKALHEIRAESEKNSEIAIDNISIDKITKEYLVEIKKSDADQEAVRWQVLYYLKVLKDKGIIKKGKIEFIEKKKSSHKIIYETLTEEKEKELDKVIIDIENLILQRNPPEIEDKKKCKACAYNIYCTA